MNLFQSHFFYELDPVHALYSSALFHVLSFSFVVLYLITSENNYIQNNKKAFEHSEHICFAREGTAIVTHVPKQIAHASQCECMRLKAKY